MYDEMDFKQLEQQIFIKMQSLKNDPEQVQILEKNKNKKLSRAEI